MGKRIRHLEYYGFTDQNVYIGLPNLDLSDIRETNREQDKDIDRISSEKADVTLVNELSGKVDSFIETQSEINKKVIHSVKAGFDAINELKERDKEITDKINEIGDKFDPIYDKLGEVTNTVSSLEDALNEHISNGDSFSKEASEQLAELDELVKGKLDKAEADETFAKKDDTYTKTEIDRFLENHENACATKEWVLGKKYLSLDDADGRYASKHKLNALEDRVGDIQTNLYNKYNQLNSEFTEFRADADFRIKTIYGRVDTLEDKFERGVGDLVNKDKDLQDQINKNKEDITRINEVSLPSKVDYSTFNNLKADVENLTKGMDGKVDKDVYDRDRTMFGNSLDKLDNKKADKTALNETNSKVDSVLDKLMSEIEDRVNGDKELKDAINRTNDKVDEAIGENGTTNIRISNLESDLKKERDERIASDRKIVGSENDKVDTLSIYGLKKYTDLVAGNSYKNATAYTETAFDSLRGYINDEDNKLRAEISAKADKKYIAAVKDELENTIDSKVGDEKTRAENVEASLASAIRKEMSDRLDGDRKNSSAVTHTSNIVKAITDWDGDDRVNYTDEGNGILDVLHREFHEFEKSYRRESEGLETTNKNESAFGSYNKSNTGDEKADQTIFSVGIGTSEEDRKNAFEIRKNGDIYMWIEGEFMKINSLIAMLAHETY